MKANVLTQSANYALGLVMMKGVSVAMMPYITRHISAQTYGLMETLVVLADIGTIIIGCGLIEALYRFVGSAKGTERSRLIANCVLLSISAAVLGALGLLSALPWLLDKLPAGIEGYQLLLIAVPTLLEGLIAIPLTLIRMLSLAKWFCLLNAGKALIQALLIVVFLENGWGIDAILIAGAISSVLLVAMLWRFQWRQMAGSGVKTFYAQANWRHSAQLLKYGGPIVISRIGLFAITGLDRWLLADKAGVASLAVYAIAVKFALVLGLMVQPFTLWWFPNRFRILQQVDGRAQCADYALIGTNIGIMLATMMILTVPPFIELFLPAEYQLAASLVVAMTLVNMLKNAGDLLNLGCFSGESSQSQMWIQWLCAALAIAGYGYFIPLYGVWAAVSVLGAVYALRLMLFYVISQMKEPLPYRHRQWLSCALICALVWAGAEVLLQGSQGWLKFIVGGLLSLLLAWLLVRLKVFPDIISPLLCKWRNQNLQNAKQY